MEIFELLSNYGKSWLKLAKSHTRLFMLEVKLAKMSVVPFIICLLLVFILLISTWLSALVLLGYGIYFWSHNPLVSLICVFAINLIAIIIVIRFIFLYYRYLSFKRTRHHLKAYHEN